MGKWMRRAVVLDSFALRGGVVLTPYQTMLLGDLRGPNSYGTPLVGWKAQNEFFKSNGAPAQPGPLSASLASTFVEAVYILLRTQRVVQLYRGYETAGLKAPFGVDHPSFIQGLVAQRKPGTPDGQWWTPTRPSMAIDNMRLPDADRSEHRGSSAITLEWNRIDFYLEGALPAGTLVYVGRAAPQQEGALYGGKRYGGGAIQFRLLTSPDKAFPWLKRYVAS
jgi:hypothetical protein